MNAEIIAIGTELLLGTTVDTNSTYLEQQLATVGVPVRRVTLVRDDLHEIVGVICEAMARVEIVICSGGLGPTGDDLTRDAIARATDHPLEFHQTLLNDIAARFAAFRRTMSDSNRQQAFVPQGAYIIRNPRGTAPAFVAERDGHYVAALPGVPQELRYLTEHALLPYLRDQHGLRDTLIVREICVVGLTEAEAGERINDIMLGDNPVVGISAKGGQHMIRIAARGQDRAAAEALITPLADLIGQRFAGFLLGEERLDDRVGRLLAERGIRLNLIENDLHAPIFRALTQTDHGRDALATVRLQRDIATDQMIDEPFVRALAADLIGADATLVALVAGGDEPIRPLHLAIRGSADPSQVRYVTRGIDFGLPQAHDFVATTALDLVWRWLEADG